MRVRVRFVNLDTNMLIDDDRTARTPLTPLKDGPHNSESRVGAASNAAKSPNQAQTPFFDISTSHSAAAIAH